MMFSLTAGVFQFLGWPPHLTETKTRWRMHHAHQQRVNRVIARHSEKACDAEDDEVDEVVGGAAHFAMLIGLDKLGDLKELWMDLTI